MRSTTRLRSRSRLAPGPVRRVGPVQVAAAVLVVVAVVALGSRIADDLAPRFGSPGTTTTRTGAALVALRGLAVKGRAPRTGYSREQFGQAWADVDHDGCDTRDDVLARDLKDITTSPGDPCVVVRGVLNDPYQPSVIDFERGPDSAAVQIDHVVALSDAWQTGAAQWPADARLALANDPLNLLAVDGPLNNAKGDGDAATWLPPNTSFRCTYVARQIAVKAKYGAWVTRAERAAMEHVLGRCPDQGLPDGSDGVGPVVGADGRPALSPATTTASSSGQ